MSLSIEDLEAIKAIMRKTVREELERAMRQTARPQPVAAPRVQQQQPTAASDASAQDQSAEVVARIRRN